ncbi:hypothetical protein OOZ15_05400 [Galbibacter sp. EGI 63066]|uniref:hypothetical protein n=1 Tax=Galbibacter sp. EGI 63066 TaxID=2993559 RepID=UPI002248DD68|nr:hypothetical protein [Galbibacter sp. EGI 63066]MCX2679372.1 hypothetical protein [Galbibacter sp. EGI 63066]
MRKLYFLYLLIPILSWSQTNTFPDSGNVGIGTITPSSTLEVKSDANTNSRIHINTTTDGDPSIIRFQDAGETTWGFLSNYPTLGKFSLYNYQNNSNALVLNQNGDIGIGTSTPRTKLHVNGSSESQSASIISFGTLSDSDFVTSNIYRSFSGSTYTDGISGNIGKYISYRSIFGGYSNYNGNGPGFYSQGHYPRMFMEVISGNHGAMSGLPTDSPIKNGYIYQQIKGPAENQLSTPVKATNNNSQWLWGVSSAGNIIVAGKIESREVKVTVNAGADFVFEDNYNLPTLEEVQQFIQENGHLPEIPSAKDMETSGIHLSEMNIKLLQKIEELTLYTIEQEKRLKEEESEVEKLKIIVKEQQKLINQLFKKFEE